MDVADPVKFDIYFDYQCPFVFRASRLIDAVEKTGARSLDVGWRYFSLTQVNTKDEGWTVWGAPETEPVRGRLAFKAAESARRQDRFETFHRALLRARHIERLDIDDAGVVAQVAEGAGLDPDRFRSDLADPAILSGLERDHTFAVAELGVFGTPTLVFDGGGSAYVRLAESVVDDGALAVFDRLVSIAASEPRILEIKRPFKR